MTRSLFDPLVDAYDAARPSYPAALYDDLDRYAGPLANARVVEVGAGTGIATRGLLDRGARVCPIDVGSAMLARLRRRTPSVTPVLGSGEALPLRDGVADLVGYAQAWHWMGVAPAAAEAVRVLRPGGALAVWWNDVEADDEPWWQEQQDRLETDNPDYRRGYRSTDYGADIAATGLFDSVEHSVHAWVRELDVETYLTWLRSKSYVAALGSALENFLVEERASLREAFPDGIVREPFRTRLWVLQTDSRQTR